eukprot:15354526-Ditylum_brightwellii.AAC.1
MQHHFKAANGISELYYMHMLDFGKYGKGQQKESCPPNWQLQSSILLSTLESQYTSICLISTCKWYTAEHIGEAYVNVMDNRILDQLT